MPQSEPLITRPLLDWAAATYDQFYLWWVIEKLKMDVIGQKFTPTVTRSAVSGRLTRLKLMPRPEPDPALVRRLAPHLLPAPASQPAPRSVVQAAAKTLPPVSPLVVEPAAPVAPAAVVPPPMPTMQPPVPVPAVHLSSPVLRPPARVHNIPDDRDDDDDFCKEEVNCGPGRGKIRCSAVADKRTGYCDVHWLKYKPTTSFGKLKSRKPA